MLFAAFYEILGIRGRGGHACVYHACDRRTNKEVAIKHFQEPENPELVYEINRLGEQEAKVLKVLGQGPPELRKNIPRLYTTGYEGQMCFLVMEYIPYPTLVRYTRKRLEKDDPWTIEELGQVLLQVAALCDVIHQQQVVIRDIKPSNILICPETLDVVLIDFSIALYLPYKRFWSAYSLICCSDGYAPPEIKKRNVLVTPSYDSYSFGRLLRNCAQWPCSPFPKAYQDLVETLLQKDPQCRPSMSEAHAILHSLFGTSKAMALQ